MLRVNLKVEFTNNNYKDDLDISMNITSNESLDCYQTLATKSTRVCSKKINACRKTKVNFGKTAKSFDREVYASVKVSFSSRLKTKFNHGLSKSGPYSRVRDLLATFTLNFSLTTAKSKGAEGIDRLAALG